MTLLEIEEDIEALGLELGLYEEKYGVDSGEFYRTYCRGVEPGEESWVMDWADWAGAYKTLLRRLEQKKSLPA